MPLISLLPSENQIRSTIKEAISGQSKTSSEKSSDLKEWLSSAGLSPQEILDQLGSIARCGDSDAIKLRAIELGAKLNGLLSEDTIKSIPVVNIIIHDSQFTEVNPILIPR